MANRRICIGPNLGTDSDGALMLSDTAYVTPVWNYVSTGPGRMTDFGTTLPGQEMESGSHEVTNDADVARPLMVVWSRPPVYLRVAQPNAVQVRMKATVESGSRLPPESTPNPSASYDAAFTAGTDVDTDDEGTPVFGHYTRAWPGGCYRTVEIIDPGDKARFSWSTYVWSPPPWSNNASDNNPLQVASVGSHTVWAAFFPNMEEY